MGAAIFEESIANLSRTLPSIRHGHESARSDTIRPPIAQPERIASTIPATRSNSMTHALLQPHPVARDRREETVNHETNSVA
jgi:hypothetical protein